MVTARRAAVLITVVAVPLLLLAQSRRPTEMARAPATGGPAVPGAATGSRVVAEGHVVTYPGAQVVVGTDMAGTVVRLQVQENDEVQGGQVVALLRAQDLRAALDEARTRVAEAEAHIRLYEREAQWAEDLLRSGVLSTQAHDRSIRDRDTARVRKETALAETRRIQSVLDKTRIVSPIAGTIVIRHVDEGETVEAGLPIVTVADLKRVRVEAEVDEFDAGHVALGAEATVWAEGYDGQRWKGRVEEIPHIVVNRRLQPRDPARPTDTRVLLVKVALGERTPLKLGQRVQVEIR